MRRPVESGLFTSAAFTGLLQATASRSAWTAAAAGATTSFVERLWRSIKYEEACLHAYPCVSEARTGIGRYHTQYNTDRPHSRLADRTPDEAYFMPLPLRAAA